MSTRGPDTPRYFRDSDLLWHLMPDAVLDIALSDSADDTSFHAKSDMTEVLSAFSGLPHAKAHFFVHQALLRAKAGRDMEPATTAEMIPVQSRASLPIAFSREVSERMIAFTVQHFGEPEDRADTLVHFIVGREIGYLSDKLDDAAISMLEDAYRTGGEEAVFSRLSVWLRQDVETPAIEGMRRHLVRMLGMSEFRSDVFIRFARPYLDAAYARCFASLMRHAA